MSKLVIIAGPQAAGKSTVIGKLGSDTYNLAPLFPEGKAPLFFALQESRQITVHRHILLGAVSFSAAHEHEVVQCDLERMDIMLQRTNGPVTYLDECNIFTIAHARAHGTAEIEPYFDQYLERLTRLAASVIFLDIPPEVSWDRRKRRYEQRLAFFAGHEHEHIMAYYRDYLFRLHPLLHDTYQRLRLRKVIIDARSSPENVLKEVCQQLACFA